MKKQTKSKSQDSQTPEDTLAETPNDTFPIVGIGASAGGLEALEQFFSNMPTESGMAFVVVQHLAPNYKGMMAELLRRVTQMSVLTVTDNLKVKPNCVYIIPSNKSMSILNGALYLFVPLEERGLRLPVDFLFRSLADDRHQKSIGIILSGMGSDGSLGVKAINEKNGIVLVQEPSSAKFDAMPRNAIKATTVDVVAPANELPAKLLAIIKGQISKNNTDESDKDNSSLDKIIIILRTHTGNDFSQYKKNTLYRRIERRMSIHQIDRITSYVRYLQENPNEVGILFQELLIGVTNFFRDTPVWEYLKDSVLPPMLEEASNAQTLRAWIPACSTGEEAYSLAMIFKEALEKANLDKILRLQIFATDLDSTAVDQARRGIYQANMVSHVSASRLNRFFTKEGDQFRVSADIREMIVFAPQNIVKDPPFTKLNMLFCRNLLIYIDTGLQKKIMSLFHYALNDRGILLLGNAETYNEPKNLFTTVDSKLRIYQKTGASKVNVLLDFPSAYTKIKEPIMVSKSVEKNTENLQALTYDLLLQQFSPASVLTTNLGDILYITGNVGKYFSPAAGKANLNIFAMANEGLRNELPIAFRKAMQSYEKVVLHAIKIVVGSETLIVDVTIQQIASPFAMKGKVLLFFADLPLEKQEISKLITGKKGKAVADIKQIQLGQEMQRLSEDLQNTQEEMQTSQEELKSANEELQSANEEMQSANEELTTSKEEMQSMNEELQTINAELQVKIHDSDLVKNDMHNLLNSSEIATLFLDKELKIRQFTFCATKIFKLIPGDIGRLFTDLASDMDYPDMAADAKEVLRTLTFVEKVITTRHRLYYTVRIMPYRTFDDKINGLVITFIDITVSKQLENALRETQVLLRSVIHSARFVIIALSSDGKVIEFNPEAENIFGRKSSEVINKSYLEVFIPKKLRAEVGNDLQKLLAGTLPDNFAHLVEAVNGSQINIEWTPHKLFDEKGILIGIITIGENITKA